MISVIIPTIWVGQRYKEMLPAFEEHPLIGEVILIDNDTTKTDQKIFEFSKLVYLPQKQNIYVNPAWNLGAQTAKYDTLCFANDDISIDLGYLEKALDYVSPKFGMLGLGEKTIRSTLDTVSLESIEPMNDEFIIKATETQDSHYATFFLIHKESYIHIPEEIKVYFGDSYNFAMNKERNRQNHQLVNGRAVSRLRTTSRLFLDVIAKDKTHYQKYRKD